MYTPETFKESRPEVLKDFILANSFASLVTAGSQGIVASHLPYVFDPARGRHGVLISHMAKANPQWRDFSTDTDAMAIFLGPHAYISPTLYESKLTVPTWNYTAVHAYGRPHLLSEMADVLNVLKATVKQHEGDSPEAWHITDVPEDFIIKMAQQVVAFEIEITRIEGKFKLNQNRALVDQQRVASVLTGAKDDIRRAVGELMSERMENKARRQEGT